MASLKLNLRAAALIGSLLIGASPALAEAVLHRGNAGEPQTLDQHHTSINIEAFILKDLYEGLTIYDASAKIVLVSLRRGSFRTTVRSIPSSCAPMQSGRMVRR